MTDGGLPRYLENKASAMRSFATSLADGDQARETIHAECEASDLTGVRRLTIRDFQLISDSGPAFGGYSLGPSSPELLLGVLATCLTHTYLIAAASRSVSLDKVHVRLEAENNDARLLGLETSDPGVPFNIRAFVHLESAASAEILSWLHDYVDQACPLTRIIREPQAFRIERT